MPHRLSDDLAYARIAIVNVYFVGSADAGDRGWVLVDAGLPGSAAVIERHAAARYGPGSRPSAILLTHGHFDHIGAANALSARWDVPVYVHPLEVPYLTGHSAYPPPDPTVGGGAMSALSPLFSRGPFTVDRIHPLPEDGSVPGLDGWTWLHTPGHSPGHTSFFRDDDRVLIAGDAFVTTIQESLVSVLLQSRAMHGPPAYFTPDWEAARRSVEMLAALDPSIAATGHGRPLYGGGMREALRQLANDFQRAAVPAQGRYVGHPAVTDETGVVSLPRPVPGLGIPGALLGLAAALALGGVIQFGRSWRAEARRAAARARTPRAATRGLISPTA